MIEPTDDMVRAFRSSGPNCSCCTDDPEAGVRRSLAAVLAILERDYDVTPKLPPVEHRTDGVWWNHYAQQYQAECACGETFSDGLRDAVTDRLLDHLECEARP